MNFFTEVFNRMEGFTTDTTLARDVICWTLTGKCIDLADYLVSKLSNVSIRTEVKSNGVKIHKVSGKKGHHHANNCQSDDVSVALVMAHSLFEKYANLTPHCDDEEQLLRLDPIG